MDNIISKILKYIGIGTIVIGIIASIAVASIANNAIVFFSGTIGSIISGMVFIGFSAIINLLQQNVNNQEKMIYLLNKLETTKNENESQEESISKSINSTSNNTHKHLFRCEKCGKMIESFPCINCGNNPEN